MLAQEEYLQTVKSLSRVSRQVVPPAIRLEHRLHPWVYFAALPLFALTNAGVRFIDGDPAAIFADPVLYGVMLGLLIGKPIGIMLMSFLTVKLKAATLPQGVTWLHMLGAGILGGVCWRRSRRARSGSCSCSCRRSDPRARKSRGGVRAVRRDAAVRAAFGDARLPEKRRAQDDWAHACAILSPECQECPRAEARSPR